MTGPLTTPLADPRSLCGLLDCAERAFSLFAWPKRPPVPVCKLHRDAIIQAVDAMLNGETREFTQDEWVRWLKQNAKPHLLSGSSR